MSDQGVGEPKQVPFMAKALLAVNEEEEKQKTLEYLMSPFDKRRDGEPKVHLVLSGPPAAGMTFPLHYFLKRAVTVDDSENNSGGGTPPELFEVEEEVDKNYDKVQETKNAFTQHQHNRAVLKIEKIERVHHSDEPKTWTLHTRPPKADACE